MTVARRALAGKTTRALVVASANGVPNTISMRLRPR